MTLDPSRPPSPPGVRWTPRTFAATGAVALTDFVLLAIAVPNFINMHSDLALIGAIGAVAASFAASGWLVLMLRRAH